MPIIQKKLSIAIIALIITFCYMANNVVCGESIKESSLKEKISKNPNDATLYLELGRYYQQKNNNDEAIKCLSKSIELAPKLSDGYFYLSVVYGQKGDMVRTIKNMEKVNELTPNKPYILENLAKFYTVDNQNDKAVAAYKEMIALNPPTKKQAMIELADLYEKLGTYQDAINIYNEICKENPKDSDAKQKLNFLLNKKELSLAYKEANIQKPAEYVVKSSESGASGEMVYEIENPKARLGLLIYRAYDDDFDTDSSMLEKKYITEKLTFKTHDFEQENKDLFKRYGYFIGVNSKGEYGIVETGELPVRSRVLYPNELEPPIQILICKSLLENDCSIVDITPIKSSLNSSALSDVIVRYRKEQGVDAFFIFCYQLYSKMAMSEPFRKGYSTGTRYYKDYGLICEYTVLMIDAKTMDAVSTFSGNAKAIILSTEKSGFFGTTRKSQAPVEWIRVSDKGSKGLIKRDWLEDNLLSNMKLNKSISLPGIKERPLLMQLNDCLGEYFNKKLESEEKNEAQ